MRPRAGHGWTWIYKSEGGRPVHMLANEDGEWIPTGKAKGWPRCTRCRKPIGKSPFESGRCNYCYFSDPPVGTFWDYRDHWLFPYNIGARVSKAKHPQERYLPLRSQLRLVRDPEPITLKDAAIAAMANANELLGQLPLTDVKRDP